MKDFLKITAANLCPVKGRRCRSWIAITYIFCSWRFWLVVMWWCLSSFLLSRCFWSLTAGRCRWQYQSGRSCRGLACLSWTCSRLETCSCWATKPKPLNWRCSKRSCGHTYPALSPRCRCQGPVCCSSDSVLQDLRSSNRIGHENLSELNLPL